jgi:hypothetical protein
MSTLDPSRGIKPLDFGKDGITGSVYKNGGLIAVNIFHAEHGYVTLTTAAPFPEDQRYDPQAVRRYRESLAHMTGFGPHFESTIVQREVHLSDNAIPHIQLMLRNGGQVEITVAHAGGAIRFGLFRNHPIGAGSYHFKRCAYTSFTEGGRFHLLRR